MVQTDILHSDSGKNTLWSLMLDGDVSAFENLMEQHFQVLYQYGSKFSKDPEFVKDTIQDLFLYIWEHRSTLSNTNAVRPYLMASLRRMMHRVTLRTPATDTYEDNLTQVFNAEFSVEQNYIRLESSRVISHHLQSILDDLPARQKEVIYLKFYQGLSRDLISQVMDISPQTVSNLLQIAIKQLRHQINSDYISIIA
jgi:RNA polymerase sigma factor (sigma-70 family)